VCVRVCVNCVHVYVREKRKRLRERARECVREREKERKTGRTERDSSTLRFLEGVSVGGSVAVSDSASVKPLRCHSCQNTQAQAHAQAQQAREVEGARAKDRERRKETSFGRIAAAATRKKK